VRPHCSEGGLIYRLGSNGERDDQFGSAGALGLEHMHMAALEPSGAMIVSRRQSRALILGRLTPTGARDPRFGSGGSAKVDLPSGSDLTIASVLVEKSGGGILVVGYRKGTSTKRGPASFLVARLFGDGKIDRGFGDHGWVRTAFPRPLEITSAQATLDRQGRLVVAGETATPGDPEGAFLVARYLLRR
jgi:hypothetical protein